MGWEGRASEARLRQLQRLATKKKLYLISRLLLEYSVVDFGAEKFTSIHFDLLEAVKSLNQFLFVF